MDHRALIEAASTHFGKDEARGRNYLEKLINFSYYLPTVRFESINRSLRKQLDFLADDVTMWELIRANMDNNPRRIRRFVNTFNLAIATLARGTSPTEERQRQVAVLLMFREKYPAFFEMLRRDEELLEQLEYATENRPASIANLPARLAQLVESDPGLLDAVASVSKKRKGFDFPPFPTASQVATLTEAMVLMPLPPPIEASQPTIVTDTTARLVR